MFVLLLCLLLPLTGGGQGVHSLSVEEAVAAGIPLSFSSSTALATLHTRHEHSLHLPGNASARSSMHAHYPALRQIAQLCASAAAVGLRDSAALWALFLGLAEGQALAQARHATAAQGTPLPPLPQAWLYHSYWGSSALGRAEAPPSLLQPLGRALGVAAATAWEEGGSTGPAAVDFLLLDGARSYEAVLSDLTAYSARATRFIALPHTEFTPTPSPLEDVRTLSAKAAIFDFLHGSNGTGWVVSAHFPNNAGLTLLGRAERKA